MNFPDTHHESITNWIAAGSSAAADVSIASYSSLRNSERPSWLKVLRQVARLPSSTRLVGILTTDPKPRFWPRVKMATIGHCGMYVHCPDYDVSTYLAFSLTTALRIANLCVEILRLGYSKAALYHGLWRDFARLKRYGEQVAEYEQQLCTYRPLPEFIPALLIAGVKKEDKTHD